MKLSHMVFQGPSVFENLMALRTRVLKGLHMFGFNVTFDIEFLRLMATLHTLPLASSETNHQRLKQVCKIKKTNDKFIIPMKLCQMMFQSNPILENLIALRTTISRRNDMFGLHMTLTIEFFGLISAL